MQAVRTKRVWITLPASLVSEVRGAVPSASSSGSFAAVLKRGLEAMMAPDDHARSSEVRTLAAQLGELAALLEPELRALRNDADHVARRIVAHLVEAWSLTHALAEAQLGAAEYGAVLRRSEQAYREHIDQVLARLRRPGAEDAVPGSAPRRPVAR